jgi:hypothetical protein
VATLGYRSETRRLQVYYIYYIYYIVRFVDEQSIGGCILLLGVRPTARSLLATTTTTQDCSPLWAEW